GVGDAARLSGLDLDLDLDPEGRLLDLGARFAWLDLAELSAMLRAWPWPLPEGLQGLLERNPRGSARDLTLRFAPADSGADATGPHWQVSGRLSGLGLDRREPMPGFSGLDLWLAGDQDGGWVRFGSEGLNLDLNPIFDRPLRFDQFSGRLDWRRRPSGGWHLAAHELVLENADLGGQARFALDLPGADGRPVLDLRARLRDANAAHVRLYLPTGLMPPKLVDWLEAAIVSGHITQGDVIFHSAPADTPFSEHQGRFELKLEFEDLRLDYQPGWPALTAAAGHLHLLDQGLKIRVDRGRLLDSAFRAGRVDVPDLSRVEQLHIHGEVLGPFEDGRRALAETPLSDTLGGLAEILQVSGQSQLVLDMDLPLVRHRALGVSGVLSWPAPATLGVRGTGLQLSDLSGAIRFDEHGIRTSKIGARLAGRPLELSLHTQNSGLHLGGRIEELDLGAWSDWVAAVQAGRNAAAKDGIALTGLAFDVDRLHLGGRTLQGLRLRGTPSQTGWRFHVATREVAGLIRPADPDNGTRLDLDLERLDLKALMSEPASARPPSRPERVPDDLITELPSLDLHVARLDWGERTLGALEVSLHRDALGVRLPRLRLNRPGLLSVEGTGEWIRAAEGGRSRLDLRAETPDLRRVLTLFDESTAIEAKGARAHVQLQWPDGPTRFAWAQAEGGLEFGVEPGRLLQAEPGVGRLLGFLDIGSLGRRLALDFSDLYGQGFAFSRLDGRIAIRQGRARFEEVLIEGPAGRVMVGGVADLVDRRLDQVVTVEPKLGTGLALAGAMAGGPVVGAAVYLVDRATGNTLNRLGRYQYRVTGPWSEPEWTRLGWEPLSGLGERREPVDRDGTPPRPINHFLDVP
ncbi:MAG: YhdP family phospholipid transporter, partial [Thermochromatium sp.]